MTDRLPTAAALVDAGRALFGRYGYEGTSVRSLTRHAGANLGAVTYHFGSKEALYRAVLASGLEPLAAGVAEIAAQPGDALDRVEWVTRLCCAYLVENPDVPSLLVRQIAGDGSLPEPARGALARIVTTLSGVIRDGQREGVIREGEPGLLARSVLSEPLMRSLGWLSTAEPGVEEHSVEYVMAALRAPESEGRRRGRLTRR